MAVLPNIYNNVYSQLGRLRINYTGNSFQVMAPTVNRDGTGTNANFNAYITLDPNNVANPINNGSGSYLFPSNSLPDSYGGTAKTSEVVSTTDSIVAGSWAFLDNTLVKDFDPNTTTLKAAYLMGLASYVGGSTTIVNYNFHTPDGTITPRAADISYRGSGASYVDWPSFFVDNVTDLVQTQSSVATGDYAVSDIRTKPMNGVDTDSAPQSTTGSGWFLVVVLEDEKFPIQTVDLYAGRGYSDIAPKKNWNRTLQEATASFLLCGSWIVNTSDSYRYIYLSNGWRTVAGPNNIANYFHNRRRYDRANRLMTRGSFANYTPFETPASGTQVGPTVMGATLTNIDVTSDMNLVPTATNFGVYFYNGYYIMSPGAALEQRGAISNPTISKTVSPTTVNREQPVTFTIVFKSLGAPSKNLRMIDSLDTRFTFIDNSLFVNGSNRVGSDLLTVTLPDLTTDQFLTVTFKAMVSNVVGGYTVPNTVVMGYDYEPITGSILADTITATCISTIVDIPLPRLSKAVDLNYAYVEQTITYTINVFNQGNTSMVNTKVFDTIPTNSKLVPGSVTIDGVTNSIANPAVGVNLATITGGQTKIIKFKVYAETIPAPNPMPNTAYTLYDYTVLGIGSFQSTTLANTVTTKINDALITKVTKIVDKASANVGQTLTYTVSFKNRGNVQAENLIFTDTFPTNIAFVENSLKINGATSLGADPQVGLSLSNLSSNASYTIEYKVFVTEIPPEDPIINIATLDYDFIVDPILGTKLTRNLISTNANTKINNATFKNGGITKVVDKLFADLNQVLTYTVTLTNKGNVTATNVVLVDNLDPSLSFVNNSVIIDGLPTGGVNPLLGIPIVDISAGQTITVGFKATVISIPATNSIPNIAKIDYKYTVSTLDDTIGRDLSSEIFSVISRAIISNTDGGLVKKSISNYADVGDIVTYSFIMDNTGNSIASSMFLIDTIPNGMTFIPGTVKVNGIAFPDYNPNVGCDIGNLSPTSGKVVTFDVTVDTIPVNPINNVAHLSYNYTVDPAFPNGASQTNATNIYPITVNHGLINMMAKGTDINFAKKGNTINYTITIPNAGNVDITNVILKDTIPFGTSVVPNSILVNGVSTSGNIQSGISLGTIGVGGFKTVSFTLRVDTIPDSRLVTNEAVATFKYTTDPSIPNGKNGYAVSNKISTAINQAIIDPLKNDFIKSMSKKYALVGDTVTYTLFIRNSGNVTADVVDIRDILNLSTMFIPGTVKVNSIPKASANPNTGISVGSLAVDGIATVTFDVKVMTIPSTGMIPNTANVDYSYILDPVNGVNSRDEATTNSTTVYVNQAGVIASDDSFKITVDKSFAEIGETIEYTIILNNYGNADIYDSLVVSTIPDGTRLVPNSVKINNVVVDANPMSSIEVGTIPKGTTKTIKYKVLVDTLPLVNPLINSATAEYVFTLNPSNPKSEFRAENTGTVKTTVNQAIVGVVKSVDKPYVKIGDTAKYSFVLKNTGNVDAYAITIYDTIPSGTVFIGNTVKVNGIAKAGVSPNAGVIIPKIAAGGTSNVEFQVRIQDFPNSGNTIPNSCTTEYNYIIDPSSPNGVIKNINSNNVDMIVRDPNIKPSNSSFIKYVNKDYAVVDETLTYSLIIKNMGNARATNVLVTDTIPTYTSFVTDTVYVNSIQSLGTNPAQGISIATVDPGESVTITFDVLVNSIPPSNSIPNAARLKYNFTVNPNNVDQEAVTILSNTVLTNIREANISVIKGGLRKTVNKAFADLQEVIEYTISMTNLGNVNAENVTLIDTIPVGSTLVPGSIKLNGTTVNSNPSIGILVGNLLPDGNAVVQFSVEVTTLPQSNPITNVGLVNFTYRATETSTVPVSRTSLTEAVSTKINAALINLNVGVDKTKSIIGDTIQYTAKIKNEGNATASNVVFYGSIPDGTTLLPSNASLQILLADGEVINKQAEIVDNISSRTTVDGNTANGNPLTGVIIGQLPAGAQVIVEYDVLVVSLPNTQNFVGNGTVTFAYTVIPGSPSESTGSTTAQVSTVTTISDPEITVNNGSLSKYVNKAYAKVTDVLKYSIVLSNSGNTTADNVIIKDTLPQGTLLVQNSVMINGVPQVGVTNLSNLNIGTIDIGNTVTVTFEVVVVMVPWNNPILNSAYVTYDFNLGLNNRQINTNEVSTQINFADMSTITGGLIKSVNKAYGKVGEEVTYNVDIVNKGNVDANNVMVIDTLPEGLEFIANSVIINSVTKPGVSPDAGIWLGVVNSSENINIKFKGKIVKIPTVNPMANSALINYNYTIDPSLLNGEDVWNKSNSVNTKVNNVTFTSEDGSFVKIVDKSIADINSNINYTIVVKNTGNVSALGAIIKDVISTDTPLVPGSLMVNGVNITNANLATGLNIGNVNVSKTVTIQFSVMATSIPSTNPVLNKATVDYLFVKDPLNEPNGETSTGTTNETNVQIKTAGPLFSGVGGFYKEFSKDYAKLGDCVTCKFEIPNNGNVPMKNVVLIDSISPYLEFATGSIYIDGLNNATSNPNTGIAVGDINPGEVKEVLFKTTVTSIPLNNPIENVGTINYSYSIDGARVTTQATLNSNYDYLNILQAIVIPNFKKEVDKSYSDLGETLTYRITVVNTGNTDALNVKVTDLLPPEVQLIPNSIEINCIEISDADIESGILFSKLEPDVVKIITFKAKVIKIPMDGTIDNNACISYEYIVDPNEQAIMEDACTTVVQTSVKSGELVCTKESNVNYGTLGTEVSYKITLENIGNTGSDKVFVRDILPTELTVKPGSLKRDGNSIPGNILNGINLGTINAGSIANIEFVGVVNTVPKVNPINNKALVSYEVTMSPIAPSVKKSLETNTVPLTIKNGVLVLTKGSSVFKAIVGDTIDYQIVAKNIGNTGIINISIIDLLPPELEFVQNSLTVNGVLKNAGDLKSGYQIDSMAVDEVITLNYKAIIKGTNDLGVVENTAKGSYAFNIGDVSVNSLVPRSSNAIASGEAASNTVKVIVEEISQLMSKTANKSEVAIGGVIGYTVSVENTGTIDMMNVILMDSIPVGTSLIPGSFKVNGMNSLWPMVGNILVGEISQVYYEVKVNSYIENIIENKAFLKFNYKLNPTDSLKVGYSNEVVSYVTLISPNFTQLNFDGNFAIPCNKEDILSVTEVNAEVEIISSDVISTPSGVSESNFTLTGNKLVVTAIAKIVVEYISNTPTKTLGTVTCEKLFTRYIVLPDSYTIVPDIEVNSLIEDLYAVEVGSREIFFNLTIFLYASL